MRRVLVLTVYRACEIPELCLSNDTSFSLVHSIDEYAASECARLFVVSIRSLRRLDEEFPFAENEWRTSSGSALYSWNLLREESRVSGSGRCMTRGSLIIHHWQAPI